MSEANTVAFMLTKETKTVWILGAGFSRSLGGPLLMDLFRPEYLNDLESYFPDNVYPDLAIEMKLISGLYAAGLAEGRWLNPEAFLAFADEACTERRGGSGAQAILSHLTERLRVLDSNGEMSPLLRTPFVPREAELISKLSVNAARFGKRAMAAECHRFLMEINPNPEEWEPLAPYRRWADRLNENPGRNTVLSFNYDRVPEIIRLTNVVMPSGEIDPRFGAPVLKLHGSVDWAKNGQTIESIPPEQILKDRHTDVAIATPGRSKSAEVRGPFKSLWNLAGKEIREASTVVLLGYSFPQTDRFAHDIVTRSIGQGNKESTEHMRRIEVVLGPGNGRADIQRVLTILGACRSERHVANSMEGCRKYLNGRKLLLRALPLGAEDYIGMAREHFESFEPVA